jgi:hypothetical protein
MIPATTASILKPNLTIRIALVGHRFTEEAGRLESRQNAVLREMLGGMFATLMAQAEALRLRHAAVFSAAPPVCRLVSSLASGADLIAQQVLPNDWQSEIILPMPAARFRLDYPEKVSEAEPHDRALFDSELERHTARANTRILTMPDPGEDATAGYVSATQMILANCDVLIAVWDGAEQDRDDCEGKPAAALKPAGTAWTMRESVRRGIPTIWLDLASGKARFVAATSEPSRLFAVEEVDCRAGPLGERLEAMLAPPSGADGHGHYGDVLARLHDALNETGRSGSFSVAYDMMVRLLTGRPPRLRIPFQPVADRSTEWIGYLAGSPQADAPLAGSLKTILLPRFGMLDTLAQAYGHRYRSTYVTAFLFSALAVFVGLLSLFKWPWFSDVNAKGLAALFELMLIGAIIVMVHLGRRNRSHQRWLDYRALAETLRHIRFLSMVGAAGAASQAGQGANRSAETWQLWYARATIREIGLPSGTLSAEYCWQVLRLVREHDLAAQAEYHNANHNNLHKVHEWLHGIGNGLFISTAILLFAYVMVWAGLGIDERVAYYLYATKPFITLLSAFLPALGAALAGIRVHGDFEGFALRSEKTANAIESLLADLSLEQTHADLAGTTQVLQSCARIMSDDLEAWEALYGRKVLVLPA